MAIRERLHAAAMTEYARVGGPSGGATISGVAGGRANTTLRLIGYWAEADDDSWPDPLAFVDPHPDPVNQSRVSDYLRHGTVYVASAGFSPCRLCGGANGSTELTDGQHFVWPEGLAHYVDIHGLRLPDEVISLMEEPPAPVDPVAFEHDLVETRRITIDDSWWCSLRTPRP